jgi:hypothetical protein
VFNAANEQSGATGGAMPGTCTRPKKEASAQHSTQHVASKSVKRKSPATPAQRDPQDTSQSAKRAQCGQTKAPSTPQAAQLPLPGRGAVVAASQPPPNRPSTQNLSTNAQNLELYVLDSNPHNMASGATSTGVLPTFVGGGSLNPASPGPSHTAVSTPPVAATSDNAFKHLDLTDVVQEQYNLLMGKVSEIKKLLDDPNLSEEDRLKHDRRIKCLVQMSGKLFLQI